MKFDFMIFVGNLLYWCFNFYFRELGLAAFIFQEVLLCFLIMLCMGAVPLAVFSVGAKYFCENL